MGIYTKKGDRGETYLVGKSKKVGKNSKIINAIGSIDELNSLLGIISSLSKERGLMNDILKIQNNLFSISSIIAGSKINFSSGQTKYLEKQIDKLEASLPKVKGFIFPGGGIVASYLMYARSIARRSEREVVKISKDSRFENEILKYLNRLSDFLYIISRSENYKNKKREQIWKVRKR